MPFEIFVPSEKEALGVVDTFFAAMDINLLMHAQFPTPESKDFFRGWLFRDTMNHVNGVDKGILVARDLETRKIASFVKWNIQRQQLQQKDDAESDDDEFPDFCGRQYLGPYADLTKSKREKVLGDKTYYHVTYLCTDPKFNGRGAASTLLGRVQAEASKENVPAILEATMNAVSFYQKLGFQIREELNMMLPARGSDEPTEYYEERVMVWTRD
ncbi:gnat family protein acetyltransferase [Fusarium beomiforme]|uniref:Gnat family protein acetyltransferase n=1 Tax=Fusarium beomiforme TaxID=44412 RepID=A0A9P5ATX5_9HYPO|nr:gnat family protein acetyltransferase [Fusarium beomiforme]